MSINPRQRAQSQHDALVKLVASHKLTKSQLQRQVADQVITAKVAAEQLNLHTIPTLESLKAAHAQAAKQAGGRRAGVRARLAEITGTDIARLTETIGRQRAWARLKAELDAQPDNGAATAALLQAFADPGLQPMLLEEAGSYLRTRGFTAETVANAIDGALQQHVPAFAEAAADDALDAKATAVERHNLRVAEAIIAGSEVPGQHFVDPAGI